MSDLSERLPNVTAEALCRREHAQIIKRQQAEIERLQDLLIASPEIPDDMSIDEVLYFLNEYYEWRESALLYLPGESDGSD